jgi:hypothetical protein
VISIRFQEGEGGEWKVEELDGSIRLDGYDGLRMDIGRRSGEVGAAVGT